MFVYLYGDNWSYWDTFQLYRDIPNGAKVNISGKGTPWQTVYCIRSEKDGDEH